MTARTQPVWQHAVAHRLRGHLDQEDFDVACDNSLCTDPNCEGSCMVIGIDGTVLQNSKGPLDHKACKRCWENPCCCHSPIWDDMTMPCMLCYGQPCRCEPNEEVGEYDPYEDYWNDGGFTDEYETHCDSGKK